MYSIYIIRTYGEGAEENHWDNDYLLNVEFFFFFRIKLILPPSKYVKTRYVGNRLVFFVLIFFVLWNRLGDTHVRIWYYIFYFIAHGKIRVFAFVWKTMGTKSGSVVRNISIILCKSFFYRSRPWIIKRKAATGLRLRVYFIAPTVLVAGRSPRLSHWSVMAVEPVVIV